MTHAVTRADRSLTMVGPRDTNQNPKPDPYSPYSPSRHKLAVYEANRQTLCYEDGSEPASVGTEARVAENRGLTFPLAHVTHRGETDYVGGVLSPARIETPYKWAEGDAISLCPLAIEPGTHKVMLLARCSRCGKDVRVSTQQQTFLLISKEELAMPGSRYSAKNIFRNLLARRAGEFFGGTGLAALVGGFIFLGVAVGLHWPAFLRYLGFPLIFAASWGMVALVIWHYVTRGRDILLYIRPGWRGYQSASALGYDDPRSFNLLTNIVLEADFGRSEPTHFFTWEESGPYSAGRVTDHGLGSLLESYGFLNEHVWVAYSPKVAHAPGGTYAQ